MKAQRILDCVVTADRQELVLYQRGDVFQIDIDGYDLMSSRSYGSEEELARLALRALGERDGKEGPKALVGGLGMGFTLRALLDRLDTLPAAAGTRVEVAEVFQAVVDWNGAHLGHLAGHPLQDPRVTVTVGDVGDCLRQAGPRYDVILLDVDNGPQALTLESNDRLYSGRGLETIYRCLTPGGVLAVWSSFRDDRFVRRFRRAGFEVEEVLVRERPATSGRKGKGQRNVIFLGKKV